MTSNGKRHIVFCIYQIADSLHGVASYYRYQNLRDCITVNEYQIEHACCRLSSIIEIILENIYAYTKFRLLKLNIIQLYDRIYSPYCKIYHTIFYCYNCHLNILGILRTALNNNEGTWTGTDERSCLDFNVSYF